jgi:hypothetical protein
MTLKTDSGSSSHEATSSSQSGQIVTVASKHHFDTFETKFFQQGDDESGGVSVEVERFDDLDELAKHKKLAPSRQFMMGVGVGSACIAIIGCLALWRSSGRSHAAPAATVDPPALVEPAPAPSAAVTPPTQAEPVPSNPVAVAPSGQAEPTPVNAAAAIPAQAEPAVAPAPSLAVVAEAQAVPAPAPSVAPPAPAQPVPAAAEKPSAAEPEPKPEPTKPVAEDKPLAAAPALAGEATEAQSRCKKAISGKRNKEILAACPDAFAADSSAADIAVALAKIEFDRGRTAQASDWGKKALAADPNAADAYVFIGGAEQSSGHRKAAKEAYKRYLQLAPGGRYAADLRAIVGSL